MRNHHSFHLFCIFLLLFTTISGCSNRQYISGTDTYKNKNCIRVLDIDEYEAWEIGVAVANSTFDSVQTTAGTRQIHAKSSKIMMGQARTTIEPVELRSTTNKTVSGFVYDVYSKSDGINQTFIPGYMASNFADELQNYLEIQKIRTNVICGFERSKLTGALGRATGTCWLVDSRGYLVTCEHVAGNKRTLEIVLPNGAVQTATVVLTDKTNDLAILKATPLPEQYHPIPIALTKLSTPGESVHILGFPEGEHYGNSLKISTGNISSILGFKNNTTEYQLDASINGGNSGGPVFDEHGTAIGVVSSKLVGLGTEGIGYIKKTNCLSLLFAQVGISPTPSINETFSAEEIYEQYKNSVFLIRRY
ncbi:S1 family peptidase [Halodesulfovibrio marinisediminis]|uniref:Trypsin-like peptidase domain-containing protein n=1 Tax=Halodesulfovibrio marinisediminis DSM 17456 TaxID=1121457 RepID=A0A1N6FK08_9BACT|nr:serine protease [Halodesulfovibrio marinisediminis]SIN95591.1 Trypsin-like peptidase domain-containing protein [Halodesulfovibrio marinisediminis DSM 17456]